MFVALVLRHGLCVPFAQPTRIFSLFSQRMAVCTLYHITDMSDDTSCVILFFAYISHTHIFFLANMTIRNLVFFTLTQIFSLRPGTLANSRTRHES